MDEDSQAYRYWRDVVRFSRGEDAARGGEAAMAAFIANGAVFHPGEADLSADLEGFAEFGLAAPLHRFWPRLLDLVAGNDAMAARMATLRARTLIIELDVDGFAAGTLSFADDSHVIRVDNGLLLTVFEVVQLFVEVAMPRSGEPAEQTAREAAVVLELLLAQYRLLRRHAAPNALLPTPAQGEAVGELTQAANVFVVAHEVSHLLFGHAGEHDADRRPTDEIACDVLAFRILIGAYSAAPVISRAQAYGRLLGARLVFTCIELFEQATGVAQGRTHPPAAERWGVVRAAAEQALGSVVPDGVDEIWRPMEQLLARVASADIPLDEVEAVLRTLTVRERFIGEPADVRSSVRLIELSRRAGS